MVQSTVCQPLTPTRLEKEKKRVWKTPPQASTQQLQGRKHTSKAEGRILTHRPRSVPTHCSTTAPT